MAKPIYSTWTDQNTLVLHEESEPDDVPLAVLCGGRNGTLSVMANKMPNDERWAFWLGVIGGLKHADNVIRNQSTFGIEELEHGQNS